jgi:outer membrane protein assembly factor BamC
LNTETRRHAPMRHPGLRPALAVLLLASLAACSSGPLLFFTDRENEYRVAGSIPPLALPPDLHGARIKPAMVVPELPPESVANLAVEAIDPRPVSLLESGEGEYIRIQKLGNRHWLVIDEPPAIVWPRVKQFFVTSRVPVTREDPGAGWLETDWIAVDAMAQDAVRKALRTAAEGDANSGAMIGALATTPTAKLFLRVEPGIRDGTAEVHFRQSSNLIANSTWPETSSMAGVEDLLLKALGETLAQAGGETAAVSLRAQQMRARPKSRLERGAGGQPQLTMTLDFDRAWATVNQALSKAELDVTDVNRDKGIMYLRVTEDDLLGEEPGMLGRMFGGDDGYAVQLQLRADGDRFALTVTPEPETTLPPAFPEQLLTLIRNHAG